MENDVLGNALPGLFISTAGNPSVSECTIHDNKWIGILVAQWGEGNLCNNTLFHNHEAELQVSTGGRPLVSKNQIKDGNGCGIVVKEAGAGTFENNDVSACRSACVLVTDPSTDPSFRDNEIHHGRTYGVRATNSCRGRL